MERESIREVAERYRRDGYEVVIEPQGDDVPPFATGMALDMIARRPGDNVVVEVKPHRLDLEVSPRAARLAEAANAQPGWRFDLVVLEPESPVERAIQDAREPSDGQLAEILQAADDLADGGQSPYACVVAWAGLEAAMRRLRDEGELYGKATPVELMRTLYSNGLLSREQFERMRESYKIRTQLVHGLIPPKVEPESARFLTETARSLLNGEAAFGGRAAG